MLLQIAVTAFAIKGLKGLLAGITTSFNAVGTTQYDQLAGLFHAVLTLPSHW